MSDVLTDERWDRLGKWLDTVSSHRVPPQDRAQIKDMDDWTSKLGIKRKDPEEVQNGKDIIEESAGTYDIASSQDPMGMDEFEALSAASLSPPRRA